MINGKVLVIIFLWGSSAVNAAGLRERHESIRGEINTLDSKSREVMSEIFDLNSKMRAISKRRDVLSGRLYQAEKKVKELGEDTAEVEDRLNGQRGALSRRLRAIYKINDESLVRTLFSSADGKELDETLRYLRVISNRDFDLIRRYAKDLRDLYIKKQKLEAEVRRYLQAKQRVNKSEEDLTASQTAKKVALEKLKSSRGSAIAELNSIRDLVKRYDIESMLDFSFYESKGKLRQPVSGKLVAKFGVVEDQMFRFKLGHKGLLYSVKGNTGFRAVHEGRVAFVGEVPGSGRTVILDHGDHFYTVYANADNVTVEEGQEIPAGKTLGYSSEKVYFELRHFSDAIDPLVWFQDV